PTTGRFLLLIVMVVGGIGALVGDLVHTSIRYRPFLDAVRGCIASVPNDSELRACLDSEYRITAWFQLGGALTMVVLSLLLLAFAPMLIQRRHRLKPATIEGAHGRVTELAR